METIQSRGKKGSSGPINCTAILIASTGVQVLYSASCTKHGPRGLVPVRQQEKGYHSWSIAATTCWALGIRHATFRTHLNKVQTVCYIKEECGACMQALSSKLALLVMVGHDAVKKGHRVQRFTHMSSLNIGIPYKSRRESTERSTSEYYFEERRRSSLRDLSGDNAL
ncbi:hypothetical protein VNO77_27822 [Canavalia gladiata]|uniref:Uncharacterized protein n=1 Tax=Canavalia gladiata TaxID=3824 RepID=A0AAN9Q7E5_CANGL